MNADNNFSIEEICFAFSIVLQISYSQLMLTLLAKNGM